MKSDALHEWLTRLAVQAGADIDRAHEEMAQAVAMLVLEGAVEFRAPQPSTLPAPPMPDEHEADCICDACAPKPADAKLRAAADLDWRVCQ